MVAKSGDGGRRRSGSVPVLSRRSSCCRVSPCPSERARSRSHQSTRLPLPWGLSLPNLPACGLGPSFSDTRNRDNLSTRLLLRPSLPPRRLSTSVRLGSHRVRTSVLSEACLADWRRVVVWASDRIVRVGVLLPGALRVLDRRALRDAALKIENLVDGGALVEIGVCCEREDGGGFDERDEKPGTKNENEEWKKAIHQIERMTPSGRGGIPGKASSYEKRFMLRESTRGNGSAANLNRRRDEKTRSQAVDLQRPELDTQRSVTAQLGSVPCSSGGGED